MECAGFDETVLDGHHLRSILPGLSWNQYWYSGLLRRASNSLVKVV